MRHALVTFACALSACLSVALPTNVHGQGETATNTPPYSRIFVRGGPGDFVGLTNVVVIHRQFRTAQVLFDVGSVTDADGDVMEFHWWDSAPGSVTSTAARFTNDYAPGAYRVLAEITDGQVTVTPTVDFEVISALDAIHLLVADLEITGRHEQIKHLRASLRLAERAVERHNWGIAARRLDRFESGLTRHLNTEVAEDALLIERWSRAAGVVQWAIKKLPRKPGPSAPDGVFPGNSSAGHVIVQPPLSLRTNVILPRPIDWSNAVIIIEAHRQQLLSNSTPVLLTNLNPLVRIYPPTNGITHSNLITSPTSIDSGVVLQH